jgi:hypothetical protein
MSTYKLKEDLPHSTQVEIDRIQDISEGLRSSSETDFLTALEDYLYNEVILKDSRGRYVIASGKTVPTNLKKLLTSLYLDFMGMPPREIEWVLFTIQVQ